MVELGVFFSAIAGILKAIRDRLASSGECSISIFPIEKARDIAWTKKGHTLFSRTIGVMFDKGWHSADILQILIWGFACLFAFKWYHIILMATIHQVFFTYFYTIVFVRKKFRRIKKQI